MKLPLSLATFLLAAWTSVAGAQLPATVGETPVPSLAPMLKRVTPAVVNIAVLVTIIATYAPDLTTTPPRMFLARRPMA